MIEQQIEKIQRCIDQQNEMADRLSKLNGAPDITFTMVAISVVLGEVVDALREVGSEQIFPAPTADASKLYRL